MRVSNWMLGLFTLTSREVGAVALLMSMTTAGCRMSVGSPLDIPIPAGSPDRPYVIGLPDIERVALENGTRGGLALVHYDPDKLTMLVLARCVIKGYDYRGVYLSPTPTYSVYTQQNAGGLSAQFVNTAALQANFASGAALEIAMIGVAPLVRTDPNAAPLPKGSELMTGCKSATHVITGLHLGAARNVRDSSAGASASATFGVTVQGGGQSQATQWVQIGDPGACRAITRSSVRKGGITAIPDACKNIIGVELQALVEDPPFVAAAQTGGPDVVNALRAALPADGTNGAAQLEMQPVLDGRARQELPFAAPELGPVRAELLAAGRAMTFPAWLQPGRCYAVLASGVPPIREVDVNLRAPGLSLDDGPSGRTTALGQASRCIRSPTPFATLANITVRADSTGFVGAQLYGW